MTMMPSSTTTTSPRASVTRSTEPKLASVSYVALDAIAAGIFGTPFYDTEFIVPHQGREELLYAHSHVIKVACPTLYKSMLHLRLTCSDSEKLDAAA